MFVMEILTEYTVFDFQFSLINSKIKQDKSLSIFSKDI